MRGLRTSAGQPSRMTASMSSSVTSRPMEKSGDMIHSYEERRDMAPHRDACPSWGGRKGRTLAGRSSSPAVVVQRQVGDDLAPFQVEAAQVGQTLEAATLEHRTALTGVVEAHHRGQEHPLAAAQDAEGVVEHHQLWPQIPLGGGTPQAFAGSVAEPFGSGDVDAALPCLEEGLGCGSEVLVFQLNLIKYLLRQGTVHDLAPGGWTSRVESLLPAARLQGVLGGVVRAEVADRLARDRAVHIGGADVVAGRAAQHLQGQALADVGQSLVADGFGAGLFSTQRCRCERKGHGFLLVVEDREHHALSGAGHFPKG
mmetsp:Transcript_59151/g.139338  ORF Transcript_59151/g.139338 Transcript_59151/m.139338 type:complete len:313 (-) Transcript_59151:2027-2965(-)